MIPDNLRLLDVGGTFIKCSHGRSVPVDSNGSREEIVAAFREAVGEARELRVAIPGPFDYGRGIFLMKHKFAAVYGEYFADLVGIPRERCRFVHDVVAMLLGSVPSGGGNAALVTLGTGLGFCMWIDGRPLVNELGSPAVSIYNRPYRDGVLEDYASKRAVVGAYGDPSLTVKEIAFRAFAGEEKAREVFARMGGTIGEGIASILEEYGVKQLLLGGQISRSWELFAPSLSAKLPAGISVGPVADFDNATFNGLAGLD